jgi:hypothetical protein
LDLKVNDLVYRYKTDSHGCREDEVVRITEIKANVINGVIVESYVCHSCWQTGCVDDGTKDGDSVGIKVSIQGIEEDEQGYLSYKYLAPYDWVKK